MSDPRRLIEAPSTPADRVVARAAEVRPNALSAGGWAAVMKRASQPRVLPLIALSAASIAAGIGISMMAARPTTTPPAQQRRIPEVQAEAGAAWGRTSDDELRLTKGRLQINREGSTRLTLLATDDVAIQTSRSRFLAEVTDDGVSIFVQDGEVQVRTRTGVKTIKTGEKFVWPPLPEIPSQLVAGTIDSECMDRPDQLGCLEALTGSSDALEAEVSLFELGLLRSKQGDREGALNAWRDSLNRFPEGSLHPEVRLAMLLELIRARRFHDATRVAREFESSCVDDPRRAQVEQLRKSIQAAP